MGRYGVLVREDGVAGYGDVGKGSGVRIFRKGWRRERPSINCRDDGEVVLEAVEVDVCNGNGVVERVEERGVKGTE